MIKDSLSNNPACSYSDSLSWFRKFILIQDEVPGGFLNVPDNTEFKTLQIVQQKVGDSKYHGESLFTSHQLRPSYHKPIEKPALNHAWLAPLLICCFILVAIAQYGWHKRTLQIFRAFFIGRLFIQLSREGGMLSERGSFLLFSSYILCATTSIYLIINYYTHLEENTWNSFKLFIQILAAVTFFYFFKIGLFRFCGFIFKATKEASSYILVIYVFGQVAGILLLPLIVLMTYMKSEMFILVGFILFAILYAYRIYRGVATVTSSSKISAYYIFLYLCTLEFLPLVIIAKSVFYS